MRNHTNAGESGEMDSTTVATPEDRKRKHARIEEASADGGVMFHVGANFEANGVKYRLLEATPEILAALASRKGCSGSNEGRAQVFFKGDDSKEAVLCTQDQTHRVFKAKRPTPSSKTTIGT